MSSLKIKLFSIIFVAFGLSYLSYFLLEEKAKQRNSYLISAAVDEEAQRISKSLSEGIYSLETDFDHFIEAIDLDELGKQVNWISIPVADLPLVQLMVIPRVAIKRDSSFTPPISWGDQRLFRSLSESQPAATESFIFDDVNYLRRAALVANNEGQFIILGTWNASILSEVAAAHEATGRIVMTRVVSGIAPFIVFDVGSGGVDGINKSVRDDWVVRYYPSDSFIASVTSDSQSILTLLGLIITISLVAGLAVVMLLRRAQTHGAAVEASSIKRESNKAATVQPYRPIPMPYHVFRDYDIRGLESELDDVFCEEVGKAIGTLVRLSGGDGLYVARDGRLSSPRIHRALLSGLRSTGVKIIDIGVCHSGLLYFATATGQYNSGVMITASHNPKDYNGFKTVVSGKVLDGAKVREIKGLIAAQKFTTGVGLVEEVDIRASYLKRVNVTSTGASKLKVVVDSANGAAGPIAVAALEQAGLDVIPLFCDIDGNFPNHAPDPSDLSNLDDLRQAVIDYKADLGIALDGDGDRIFLIDELGQVVLPDYILMMLGKDICCRNPEAKVVYDIKSSGQISEYIGRYGGRGILWKSGHSNIRNKMLEEGALLGGELSGHVFIKDDWYGFDDGVYVALRVIRLLQHRQQKVSEALNVLPRSFSTAEIRVSVPSDVADDTISLLKDEAKWPATAEFILIDGVRVSLSTGCWGLVRSSNTESALTFRFEAETQNGLNEIRHLFFDVLSEAAVEVNWNKLIEDKR